MSYSSQNIEYTFYVIKLGRDFLRGLMKLRILAIRSEVQTSRLRYSVYLDNWIDCVALILRKLSSYNGESDHDSDVSDPRFILHNYKNEIKYENVE